ncbi:MAG: hypothetical protein WC609_00125 [Candidatus Paceibacterota bacterium]|jgi:hypothetical protein
MKPDQPPIKLNPSTEFMRPYLEARQEGGAKLTQYYLNRFLHLRDDFKDDLPQEKISDLETMDERGLFTGGNYKCRMNYIVGLSLALQGAVDDGVIVGEELIKKIGEFRKQGWKAGHGELTKLTRRTREDIDMMNRILADVIQFLETKK